MHYKQNKYLTLCYYGAEIREPKSCISYIADLIKAATIYLIQKLSTWLFRVSHLAGVYFEQQILTLLLVHPTNNLSCIKFAHIWRQVKGLCISRSEPHEAFHVATKPALNLERKMTGATIGYNINVAVANNNLRYNFRLP